MSDGYAIDYEVQDRIAYIALNRPEKHNALTDEGIVKLRAALHRFDVDAAADVAILFGRGKSFCSGADLKARLLDSASSDSDGPELMHRESEHDAVLNTVNWKPLIGALHGYVLGHALGTAMLTDFTVATPDAKLQATEVAYGVPLGGLWSMITFLTGRSSFATDLMLTGRTCSGTEAVEMGLVNKLAADGDPVATAREVAAVLSSYPQGAVRELVRVRRMAISEVQQRSRSVTSGYQFTDAAALTSAVTAKLAR